MDPMQRLTTVLVLLMVTASSGTVSIPRLACRLMTNNGLDSYLMDGDLVLGGIVQVNVQLMGEPPRFTSRQISKQCTVPALHYIRHLLAFVFAIEEINRNPKLLPNITLGFQIYDSCSVDITAVDSVLKIMSGKEEPTPNYSCYKRCRLAAFIGHLFSSSSKAMADVTGMYKYPQISYGALDSVFSDRRLFPSFYRTVPSGRSQYDAIILLLQHFGWNWVGIIASQEDSNQSASEELREQLSRSGICVEYLETLTGMSFQNYENAISVIKNSTSTLVIVYSSMNYFAPMLRLESWSTLSEKVWITSVAMNIFTFEGTDWSVFNGALMISVHKGEIPGLKEFLYTANPTRYPKNKFLRNLWSDTAFTCNIEKAPFPWCKGKLDLKNVDTSLYDVNNFRLTYSVYTAVYAVAHALHDMHRIGDFTDAISLVKGFQPWKLNRYVKKVHFSTTSGEEIFFDENGDAPARFDILNLFVAPNGSVFTTPVGRFHINPLHGPQLQMNSSSIDWGFNTTLIPRSVCSDSCTPGYRKAIRKDRPACCYDCVLCAEGEISNQTDMENCITCQEDQWSNERRDMCLPRVIEFLSYEDPFGASLASISILFSVITSGVLWIFLKHRDTPIVKANNRDLSYILLLSLLLSFLCSLLFIGRPLKVTCFFRQTAFGVIFAVAVSCVLAKTLTVVIAFNATKPGSNFRKWVGPRASICLVPICTLGQVLICIVWLIHSPPFPDVDTQTVTAKIILLCNKGSVIPFYSVVGYMGFLALLSFILAFMARKLPDRYNEAQHISFSMLVFCSVWIAFIPAYLSTKGRYIVAVEIFAILASSAGLLGCIFIPKCYIILLKPELNTKGLLVNRHTTGIHSM